MDDPDESPAVRKLRLKVDELEREVQEVIRRLMAISEMLEDRDQH